MQKSQIKLQEIALSTFSGKFYECYTFKTQLSNLISENKQINAKLHYSYACLRGDIKLIHQMILPIPSLPP